MQRRSFRQRSLAFFPAILVLALAVSAACWAAKDAPAAPAALMDELHDFSLVADYSGLKLSDWQPEGSSWDAVEGDRWRVERTEEGKPGMLAYNVENLVAFEMLAIRNSDEPMLSITVSDDGQKWSRVRFKRQGGQDLGGYWFTTTYKADGLSGNYLRIEVGTDRPAWAFRVAKVTIYAHTPPEE